MLERLLDRFERHKYGVIGTLAVHSAVLFTLAIVRFTTIPDEQDRSEMVIEMVPEDEADALIAPPPENVSVPTGRPVTNVINDQNAVAADRSLDARTSQRLDDQVMQELKDMEKNEFDRLEEERKASGEQIDMPELDPSKWKKERYMAANDRPVKVEGPTTVSYDLPGRHHRSLYIPAYLCQGSGRVVVRIEVDRTGVIRDAQVDQRASTASACMMAFASEAASKALFDGSTAAPAAQNGTITFVFMPQ
ncbi:MAG: hypothetical protein H6595_02390 [Flavobacteriales bacterium]|nr:hypothetical protein [Flavobacteriales bacterium]MCB9166308.1 hypothetical protein [Flavobacteriales bacterium]